MLTPEQRSLKSRVAIHARWAHEDGEANAQRVQRALKARFRQAREELPEAGEAQIQKCADHAYREHMAQLAHKSSMARQAKKAGAGMTLDEAARSRADRVASKINITEGDGFSALCVAIGDSGTLQRRRLRELIHEIKLDEAMRRRSLRGDLDVIEL
jgi:hypothetical protein